MESLEAFPRSHSRGAAGRAGELGGIPEVSKFFRALRAIRSVRFFEVIISQHCCARTVLIGVLIFDICVQGAQVGHLDIRGVLEDPTSPPARTA